MPNISYSPSLFTAHLVKTNESLLVDDGNSKWTTFKTKMNQVELMAEKIPMNKTRRNVRRCVKIILLLCGNQTAQKRSRAMPTINQLDEQVKVKSKNPWKKKGKWKILLVSSRSNREFDTKIVKCRLIPVWKSFQTRESPLVWWEQTYQRWPRRWLWSKLIVVSDQWEWTHKRREYYQKNRFQWWTAWGKGIIYEWLYLSEGPILSSNSSNCWFHWRATARRTSSDPSDWNELENEREIGDKCQSKIDEGQ